MHSEYFRERHLSYRGLGYITLSLDFVDMGKILIFQWQRTTELQMNLKWIWNPWLVGDPKKTRYLNQISNTTVNVSATLRMTGLFMSASGNDIRNKKMSDTDNTDIDNTVLLFNDSVNSKIEVLKVCVDQQIRCRSRWIVYCLDTSCLLTCWTRVSHKPWWNQ